MITLQPTGSIQLGRTVLAATLRTVLFLRGNRLSIAAANVRLILLYFTDSLSKCDIGLIT